MTKERMRWRQGRRRRSGSSDSSRRSRRSTGRCWRGGGPQGGRDDARGRLRCCCRDGHRRCDTRRRGGRSTAATATRGKGSRSRIKWLERAGFCTELEAALACGGRSRTLLGVVGGRGRGSSSGCSCSTSTTCSSSDGGSSSGLPGLDPVGVEGRNLGNGHLRQHRL